MAILSINWQIYIIIGMDLLNANELVKLLITKEGITVKCSNGSIRILIVKPEGKGEMNASDWANGARIKIGDKFI